MEKRNEEDELDKILKAMIMMNPKASRKTDKEIIVQLREIIEQDITNLEKSIEEIQKNKEGLSTTEAWRQLGTKRKKISIFKKILEIDDEQMEALVAKYRLNKLSKDIRNNVEHPKENTDQMIQDILKEAKEKYPIPEKEEGIEEER